MSGTLSTPSVGSPNSTEDPKIATAVSAVNANFDGSNKLDGARIGAGTVPSAAMDATGVLDADLASPNNSAYKTLQGVRATPDGNSTGTYFFGQVNSSGVCSLLSGAMTTTPQQMFRFTSGDFTAGSLTTKFRVNMQVSVGSTSPSTVTFTAGLYPLTISAGNWALGTVVTGSTALSSGLATNTISPFTSGDFSASALLTDPGHYVLGAVIGSITVPASIQVHAQLQTRNV